MTLPNLAGFYVPWSAALAASSAESPAAQAALTVQFEGMELPVMQMVLAVAGVLLARPLAPRRDQERGWLRQISVTLIMLVIALAYVAEARPGLLFTFVISIGLGFSGYALVEMAGTEIQNVIKRLFASASDAIGSIGRTPK